MYNGHIPYTSVHTPHVPVHMCAHTHAHTLSQFNRFSFYTMLEACFFFEGEEASLSPQPTLTHCPALPVLAPLRLGVGVGRPASMRLSEIWR